MAPTPSLFGRVAAKVAVAPATSIARAKNIVTIALPLTIQMRRLDNCRRVSRAAMHDPGDHPMDPDVQADIEAFKGALQANDDKAGVVAAVSLLGRALSDLHRIANALEARPIDPGTFRVG